MPAPTPVRSLDDLVACARGRSVQRTLACSDCVIHALRTERRLPVSAIVDLHPGVSAKTVEDVARLEGRLRGIRVLPSPPESAPGRTQHFGQNAACFLSASTAAYVTSQIIASTPNSLSRSTGPNERATMGFIDRIQAKAAATAQGQSEGAAQSLSAAFPGRRSHAPTSCACRPDSVVRRLLRTLRRSGCRPRTSTR